MRIFAEDLGVLLLHFSLPEAYRDGLPGIDNQWGGFLMKGAPSTRTVKSATRAYSSMTEEEKSQFKLSEMAWVKSAQAEFDVDRPGRFRNFISELAEYPESTLHFLHILLPHHPLEYLPSGRRYADGRVAGWAFRDLSVYLGQPFSITRIHQNHLFQTGFTDALVGELIAEIRRIGIYDDALIVICADHGKSFQLLLPTRNPIVPENFGDIGIVPLFIKYPGQREGVRIEENVETIDILPTIRDVVGAKVRWDFDGQSLVDPERQARKTKSPGNLSASEDGEGALWEFSEEEYLAAKRDALARRVETFSLEDPRSSLFLFGDGLELIGEPAGPLFRGRVRAQILCPNLANLQHVSLESRYIQTHLKGTVRVRGGDPSAFLLAVSVNGVVQAVTRPYKHKRGYLFDVVVSDAVFRQGKNDVQLFLVDLN